MPIGAAGGIVDTAPYSIVSRLNEEESGTMKFGIGVVQGTKPGSGIAAPTSVATVAKFEGITTNNHHTEHEGCNTSQCFQTKDGSNNDAKQPHGLFGSTEFIGEPDHSISNPV
jgi:hypothetical protein